MVLLILFMIIRINNVRSSVKRAEDNARRSMEENLDLQSRCRTLEEDLRLEKEWRQSLQDSIVAERTAMAELQQQLDVSQEVGDVNDVLNDYFFFLVSFLIAFAFQFIQDYFDLKEKHQRLLKVCTEQEKTLEEVGVRLRDTKLEADNLKLVDSLIFNSY